MENKKRNHRKQLNPDASSVTLLEVDQNVSKVFAMARNRPVMVNRYRTPFAVVMSTEMWIGASKLEDFLPPDSPLSRIKETIDFELRMRQRMLDALPICEKMQIPVMQAIRALFLQVLHSTPTEAALHKQIIANMQWRWFVGLKLNTPLWPCEQFAKELRMLLGCVEAVEMLLEMVQSAVSREGAALDFNFNIALARAWALRHPHLRARVPLEDYPGGPMILMPDNEEVPTTEIS